MQKDSFERIIHFLLGASWGIIFFGALFTFNIFITFGLFLALVATIFFIIFSLFFLLALDTFRVNRERLEEAKKQTKILEKLYTKHTK